MPSYTNKKKKAQPEYKDEENMTEDKTTDTVPTEKAPPAKGHNSGKKPCRVGGVAVDQLKAIIARIENLEQEKAGIAADIRDVFTEAKGHGFDVPAIRQILKLRKMDAQEIEEKETILDTYRRALGMIPQLDLFDDEGQGADE